MRQEIGQRLADAYLLSNAALSALRRGYAAGSIESSTAAMRLAEKLKHRDLQAPLRCVRAHAQAALGQWDEAAECYKASVALFREARPRDHASRADGRARPNRPLARRPDLDHDELAACGDFLTIAHRLLRTALRCLATRSGGAGIVSRQRTHQSRHRRRLGGGSRSIGLTWSTARLRVARRCMRISAMGRECEVTGSKSCRWTAVAAPARGRSR
jgi:hypothetical protein